MEDYKKKYEEALDNFKKIKAANKDNNELVDFIEYEYPELKESEDEKIRKELKSFFDSEISDYGNVEWRNGIMYGEIVAWLEKQGEQKVDKCAGCNNVKGCITCTDGDQYAHITEQKHTWSEEDEEMVQVAINACNSYQDSLVRNDSRFDKAVKAEEWLKSLKERIKL